MKKLFAVVCLSSVLCLSMLAVPVRAQNPIVNGVKAVASYVTTYGEQRAGIGGTIETLEDGEIDTVLIQQVSLPPFQLGLKSWTLETSLGIVHTTCFSGEKAHEGVGVGVSWRLVKIALITGVALPSISDLSEIRFGVSISVDADDAYKGRINRDATVIAGTLGFSF